MRKLKFSEKLMLTVYAIILGGGIWLMKNSGLVMQTIDEYLFSLFNFVG